MSAIKIAKPTFALVAMVFAMPTAAQVDYSVVSVGEEAGMELTRVTSDNDYVCMPEVRRRANKVNWFANRIIDLSPDGRKLAYLSLRNNTSNVFIKDIDRQGSSTQRTNRQMVLDFSYSPDGKSICFTEKSGKLTQIYQTAADGNYICRQITSNNSDYTPVYSTDMKSIFFARMESSGASIWNYDLGNNFLSTYTRGMNPCPLSNAAALLCTRSNAEGRGEIWRIDYGTGVEECIISDPNRSFSTPSVSPNGQWILCVGTNTLANGNITYANTDIFVCRMDGTGLRQLTYHAADDLSPAWSRDGKHIYFISQRGSSTATANIWRIDFTE